MENEKNKNREFDPDFEANPEFEQDQDFLNGYASVSGMRLQEMQKKRIMNRIWKILSLR